MSAYEIPDFLVGDLPADIDMSGPGPNNSLLYQYTGVCAYTALNGPGTFGTALCPPSATSSPIIGVLQNNPNVGEAGSVMIQGVTKAVLSGPVSPGDQLTVDSSGKFLRATSGQLIYGTALEAGVSGDILAVLLLRNGPKA